jgi:hypothetical protein
MKKLFILFLILINAQSILANDSEEAIDTIKIINVNNIKEVLECFDIFNELYGNYMNKIAFFKQILDQKNGIAK